MGLGVVLLVAGAAIIVAIVGNDTDPVAAGSEGQDKSLDQEKPVPVDSERSTTTARPATTPSRRTTSPPTTSPPVNPAIPSPSDFADTYVALVWSEGREVASDAEVEARVVEFRSRYGDGIFGISDGSFASLRGGTVAVAFDNNFTSALHAAQWCKEAGLSGGYGCVGVLLDNTPYSQDARGDYVRRYPEEL